MSGETKTNSIRQNLLKHNLLIVWRPEYELKIPVVDEQHRGIVSIINSLFFGMQNKHGEKLLRPVIGMVKEYTRIHFNTEEMFLRQCGYPELEHHIALHHELIQSLERIDQKSLLEQDSYEFLAFLKEWWIDHICKKDREFLEFLSSK